MSDAPDDPPLFRLFSEIGILHQLGTARAERVLPAGLTLARFGVLNHLARLGGEWTPGELARAFQVTKQTMTSTLGRLVRDGHVSISPDARDGRAKRVALTPAGRARRQLAIDALLGEFREGDPLLSPEETDALLPLLTRLRQRLDSRR